MTRRRTTRGSECTVCPPWVLKCVHFDGVIVVLGGRMDCPDFMWRGFSVCQTAEFVKASSCGCLLTDGTFIFYPTLSGAETAFQILADALAEVPA